jgi:hypothetical protein
MNRGVSFQIPNQYGSCLAEILAPVDCSKYNWKLECSTEIWKKEQGQQDKDLFDNANIMDGVIFENLIKNNIYYVIFATLKAFPNETQVSKFDTYEGFIQSDCVLCLLIADCSYVEMYCKDTLLLNKLYANGKISGFEQIEYIDDENDYRIKMSV